MDAQITIPTGVCSRCGGGRTVVVLDSWGALRIRCPKCRVDAASVHDCHTASDFTAEPEAPHAR